ncbi:MAG TPA: acyl-CoA dehydrogenase family protein [Solirubrobacteraceae bacterium]|jgi:acyl-CoA dehydrogenase
MSQPLGKLRQGGPEPELESQALGGWLLSEAGVAASEGLITVAASDDARRVPWASRADWVILPRGAELLLAPLSGARIDRGENLAGEERDRVALPTDEAGTALTLTREVVWLRGALVRAVLMAGALERICDLSLSHARDRHQFGRPIGAFQAVQAHLVTIAQQAALVEAAAEAAAAREGAFEIATAKLLAGRAAVIATRAAHQVHGAVGVTRDHPLGVQTRRLWAWRGEYGDERHWAQRLGQALQSAGADRLYPAITAGSRELEV